MREEGRLALPFLSQEFITATGQGLHDGAYIAIHSIIRDDVERQKFYQKLNKKWNKAREDKKKSQDRELDGVGAPINPIRLREK
jgi:hypothetical protein